MRSHRCTTAGRSRGRSVARARPRAAEANVRGDARARCAPRISRSARGRPRSRQSRPRLRTSVSRGMRPMSATVSAPSAAARPKSSSPAISTRSGACAPSQRHNVCDSECSRYATPVGGNCGATPSGFATGTASSRTGRRRFCSYAATAARTAPELPSSPFRPPTSTTVAAESARASTATASIRAPLDARPMSNSSARGKRSAEQRGERGDGDRRARCCRVPADAGRSCIGFGVRKPA